MPQNASRVARALRTVGANLSRFNEEGEDNLEVISALEEEWRKINNTTGANISLIDEQTGQLKSTYDILKDLHTVWALLSSDQRNYIAELIAGRMFLPVRDELTGKRGLITPILAMARMPKSLTHQAIMATYIVA